MMLNQVQKQAIHIVNEPCLILAGAGSGKTSVIINKVIVLIKIYKYDPKKIVAITFTNKAANEIKLRLFKKLTIQQIQSITISTFHSFGLKIIRNEYKLLGLKSNFTLFDEHEQCRLLKSFIFSNKKKNSVFFLKKLLFKISSWKNELLSPELVRKNIFSCQEEKYVFFYEQYDAFLKEHNILDFNDLIFLPTMLLINHVNIRLKWQKKIQYLLVDEYQDVNVSQYKLIKLLCGHNSNFTVVGDDDQSIYSWRGAEQKVFCLLKHDFPNLNIIKMEQNYRSTGCILNAANILISNNMNVFKKKLFSQLDYGNKIYISIFIDEIHEAKKTIQYIHTHKKNNHTKYQDYAILYRSNHQSKVVESELLYQNIPYHIHSGLSFFELLEIKDLLAYLRLIVNHNDDLAFLRIINTPHRKIGLVTLTKLKRFSKKNKISLFLSSTHKKMKSNLKKSTVLRLNNFILWISTLSSLLSRHSGNILKKIIDDIDYFSWVSKRYSDSAIANKRIQSIIFFSNWFKKVLLGDNINLPMTVEDMLVRFVCGDFHNSFDNKIDNSIDKLQLMTIHASKGLEFSVVCIIGIEEGILPHQRSIMNNNVTEERRLMYVGITRAKKQLCLSFCKNKKKFGMSMHVQPSRFLFELPQHEVRWISCIKNSKLLKKNKF